MRERLTVAFVVVSLLLLSVAASVRAFAVDEAVVARESAHLHQQARAIAALVRERQDAGEQVTERLLAPLVPPATQLMLERGVRTTVVTGEGYAGPPGEVLTATATADDALLTLRQDEGVVPGVLGHDRSSLVVLLAMLAALSGVLGYLIARAMAAPFRRLAEAAGALGRGRFELDLPRTRIPEAAAISQALQTSATQLEERLRREQSFAEHASHHLRTPLTGLRLELEDLSLRDDLPEEVRETAARGLTRVEKVDTVAGELVELSRAGALVSGAQQPLHDLATVWAQRWADELAVHDRVVTAGVEGALEASYTPGPIEHVLELVLAEVVAHTDGPVRLSFDSHPGGHLRVRVETAWRDAADDEDPPLDRARAVAEVLGGRLREVPDGSGLELLLPRR